MAKPQFHWKDFAASLVRDLGMFRRQTPLEQQP
jgi:hypothetical protein